MPTAENAIIYLEQGQSLVDYAALTDSGDHQYHTAADDIFSGKSGFAPDIRPNGIVTGRNLASVAASGSDDVVDVAAFTAYSGGTLYSVAADTDFAITRPAGAYAKVCSITMTSAGALAEVAGTDAADTTFSETRGADGGPPLIPVDSVEIAQVRMTSATSAPIIAAEIYQTVGQHTERYDYPTWTVNNIGEGQSASVSAATNAHIKMASAMTAIHTGPIAKKVYAKYYTPTFAELNKGTDFKPAENSHSGSTTQYYSGTINSKSTTLGQGGFTALLNDGITDSLVADKDQVLTVKYFQDRNKTPYSLTQGTIGLARTNPVADQVQAAVTITAETATAEFAS